MFGTYLRLGVPTFASSVAVVRAARQKIAEHHRKSPAMRAERKGFYLIMLHHHREAQRVVLENRL